MRTHSLATALLCLPLAAACGTSESGTRQATAHTDAGYASLGSGQAEAALESFGEALTLLDPGEPGFERAATGELEALLEVDPGQARDRFLYLARILPKFGEPRDFEGVTHKLMSAGEPELALTSLTAGLEAHLGDPALESLLDQVLVAVENATSDDEATREAKAALDDLESLGYAGGKG